MYYARIDGDTVAFDEDLEAVRAFAQLKLENADAESQEITIKIEDAEAYTLELYTNRAITGVFTRQEWVNDRAHDRGQVTFDATDYVLGMRLGALHDLEDRNDSSDDIGRAHVIWSGPFEVEVADSIREFFGVEYLEDITEEALEFARAKRPPAEKREAYVNLSVGLLLDKSMSIDEVVTQIQDALPVDLSGLVTLVSVGQHNP